MKESWSMPARLFWTSYLLVQAFGQKRAPYISRGKLQRIQNNRIRKMVLFASVNVPYYRELFRARSLRPEDFQTVEDLSRLPVLTPLQVRRNPALFRPDRINLDTLKIASSGTTGVPRWIYHDPVSILGNSGHVERSRFFFSGTKRKGRDFREAHLIPPLGAASQDVRRFISRLTLLPGSVKAERKYFSMLDEMEEIINSLNQFKPDVIRGYGSALDLLAEEVIRSGRQLNKPGVFVYSADSMSGTLKRTIIEEWGIPVFSEYNCVECLQLGFECEEHSGYHLHEDAYPVRIVDDENQTIPDGKVGKVIVSNLINRAFVLLNYELGDEAAIIPGECGCGRTLRMLSLTLSRVAERLALEDGTELHPIMFAEAVFHEKDLWQHQVIHKSGNECEVHLVTDPRTDRAAMEGRLAAEFDKWFHGRIQFTFRFVDRIQVEEGGKTRAVRYQHSK